MASHIRALLAGGLSLDEIVKREGVDTRSLTCPDFSMQVRDFQALFDRAATATGDPILGAHIAEHVTIADFQTLGYLLVNSPTIGEWLRNFERYHGIFAQITGPPFHQRQGALCRIQPGNRFGYRAATGYPVLGGGPDRQYQAACPTGLGARRLPFHDAAAARSR